MHQLPLEAIVAEVCFVTVAEALYQYLFATSSSFDSCFHFLYGHWIAEVNVWIIDHVSRSVAVTEFLYVQLMLCYSGLKELLSELLLHSAERLKPQPRNALADQNYQVKSCRYLLAKETSNQDYVICSSWCLKC